MKLTSTLNTSFAIQSRLLAYLLVADVYFQPGKNAKAASIVLPLDDKLTSFQCATNSARTNIDRAKFLQLAGRTSQEIC